MPKIGVAQFFPFVTTMLITLASDHLIGSGVGLILKMALHRKNGARLNTMFKAIVREERNGAELILGVDPSIKTVILNFENAWVVDHTVLETLHGSERSWSDRELILVGLDDHESFSSHELAVRRKGRPAVAL